MATVHNKAAQAHKHTYVDFAQRSLLVALIGLVILGVGVGFAWAHHRSDAAFVSLLGGLAVGYWVLRKVGRAWDGLFKQKLKYLRGGQIEGLVAWMLEDLPDGWHVFNNVMISPYEDVDHVLVGPGGVWAVSTKSERGLLSTAPDGSLCRNCEPTDWGDAALRQMYALRDLLKADPLTRPPYINAALAAPLCYTRLVNPVRDVTVLAMHDLVDTIGAKKGRLTPAEVAKWVEVVERLPTLMANRREKHAMCSGRKAHDAASSS